MKNENIIKLEIDNKTKHLEKYLRSQWSWKTYVFIFSLFSVLTLIVIDLEINFIKLFSDSSKYLGDIISRMLPPDFSNFQNTMSDNQIGYNKYQVISQNTIFFSFIYLCL